MDNNTDQFRTAMNPAIPQHDDEFYIDDEMVIFLVQDRLFKVHRYFLVRESPVFRDMFTCPVGPGARDGQTDDQPISLPCVTVSEFRALLKTFYQSPHGGSNFALDTWIDLLSVSSRYEMDAIRQQAISKIQTIIPPLNPIDTIELAMKYDIPDWLTPAYVSICQRQDPIEEWEAEKVGISVAMKLARARELVRATPGPGTRQHFDNMFASGGFHPGLTIAAPYIPPKPSWDGSKPATQPAPYNSHIVLNVVNEVFGIVQGTAA